MRVELTVTKPSGQVHKARYDLDDEGARIFDFRPETMMHALWDAIETLAKFEKKPSEDVNESAQPE